MHLDDDTPDPGSHLPLYPRNPPTNLFRGSELTPANFYSFEGTDGSGKSTIARRVAAAVAGKSRQCVVLRLGKGDIVAHSLERAKWLNADPITLNLLNWVSVFQGTTSNRSLFNDPSAVILADRYTMTIKVRGVLEGLDLSYMEMLEKLVPARMRIFLIDVPAQLCAERIRTAGRRISYFEAGYRNVADMGEPMSEASIQSRQGSADRQLDLLEHLKRSRELYHRLAKQSPNVKMIDNSHDIESATRLILREIDAFRGPLPTNQ